MRRVVMGVLLWLSMGLVSASPVVEAYYISPSGDDSAAGTRDAPWQTLSKVQAMLEALPAGSQLLFERGGVYAGALTISESIQTEADAPLVIGAYGEGPAPILTTLIPLEGWQRVGDHLWQAACAECHPRTDLLLINGQPQPKARFPNRDEADEGYLYFDGFEGQQTLRDDALIGQIDWTGGELVIRSVPWVLDRYPITAHVGDALSLGPSMDETGYDFEVGYGYFLQNHPAALDRAGEWVFDPAAQTITLYSLDDPNQHQIATTVADTTLALSFARHVIVQDVALHGGRLQTVDVYVSENVRFEQVEIAYSAGRGLNTAAAQGLQIVGSTIHTHLSNGIAAWGCERCVVAHTVIEKIGLLAGMGRGGDLSYNGADIHGADSRFEHNVIQQIGYNALTLTGTINAEYNLIQHFALVKVDAGGIGTYQTSGARIIGNIILYGMGSAAAIPWGFPAVNGIYIDDDSADIEVRDNVIGHMGHSGIKLHNTRRITVTGNRIFAVDIGIYLHDDHLGSADTTESAITDNRITVMSQHTTPILIESELADEAWVRRLGVFERNAYCHIGQRATLLLFYQPSVSQRLALAEWQAAYGYDLSSTTCDTD